MTAQTIDVVVLNRHIGTAKSWDGDPWGWLVFYDFRPINGLPIEACTALYLSEDKGTFYTTDASGEPIWQTDAVTILAALPRKDQLA